MDKVTDAISRIINLGGIRKISVSRVRCHRITGTRSGRGKKKRKKKEEEEEKKNKKKKKKKKKIERLSRKTTDVNQVESSVMGELSSKAWPRRVGNIGQVDLCGVKRVDTRPRPRRINVLRLNDSPGARNPFPLRLRPRDSLKMIMNERPSREISPVWTLVADRPRPLCIRTFHLRKRNKLEYLPTACIF